MEKFLLVIFFLIKIFVIIVAPVLLYIFRNIIKNKILLWIEIVLIVFIGISYLFGFSFMVDSSFSNILNLSILNINDESESLNLKSEIELSTTMESIEADLRFKTHKNNQVYYYNGLETPLSTIKVQCPNQYDYYKSYSDIITTTSMLLSSYFDKEIDPIEVLYKAYNNKLINCGEEIDKDKFFAMITKEYKVNFLVIPSSQLESYILNGKVVMIETIGNGSISCNPSYYLIYNINNSGEYMMLDPNNRQYSYICPDNSKGFGNLLKANYNEEQFNYSTIISDTNRLIVIGGTR